MKLYISYFYNIRFFPKNMIPVSTAMFDPTWYHNNKGDKHRYVDKNGIINGLRIIELSPYRINPEDVCTADCKRSGVCKFLPAYYDYLNTLNFNDVYNRLLFLSNSAKDFLKLEEDVDICLMVFEKPDNPCSERGPLLRYFKEHENEIAEFDPTPYKKPRK